MPAVSNARTVPGFGLPDRPPESVSKDDFLSAMRQAASLVSVITVCDGHERMALTVSSFLSVSAEPPMISVCINRKSRMCDAVTARGRFAVNVLASDQDHVADVFAGRPRSGDAYDFDCCEWLDQGPHQDALIADASVAMRCSVVSGIDVGSHRLFIGGVETLRTSGSRPLLYWNRLYGFPTTTANAGA